MTPADYPAARTAEKHRQAATNAERAVAELRERRTALAAELDEARHSSAHSDFSAFAATGEVTTKSRNANAIQAEIDQVDAMIAAGEKQIVVAQRHARDADREAQRAWVTAMTMSDAVEYAREAIAAIDLDAEVAELNDIERTLEKLHEPRMGARDAYAKARARQNNLLMRYRGRPDPGTGLTPDQAKAETERTLQEVTALRDHAASLRRRHDQAPQAMKERVAAALTHVGRLAGQAAERVRAHADLLERFSGGIANGRIGLGALAEAPEIELPDPTEMAELAARIEGILEAVKRPLPAQHSESDYMPRALT